MNHEVKQMWVTALRSGEYQQGHGALRDDYGKYCCLGVLCELAIKAGVDIEVQFDATSGLYFYDSCCEIPPVSVREWAGLDSGNPDIDLPDRVESLTSVNDDDTPFDQIADLIDQQL